jgi:CheY-like chemotaxis protein
MEPLPKKPQGIFVFVDDDRDEHFLLNIAMKELKLDNKMASFYNGAEALTFLRECEEDIFLILSDMNMPKMDGLELKRMIELIPELKAKCIPFFYHSNTSSSLEVKTAYTLNIQGYIRKAIDTEGTVESLKRIVQMWTNCVHPKDLDR